MVQLYSIAALLTGLNTVVALPVTEAPKVTCDRADISCGLIPGESNLYNNYNGKQAPFPADHPVPINATSTGDPGADDLLFQNLIAAEWIVFSFYQTGVEMFNESSFTDMGLPNNTFERIAAIRDNEAGHLRLFQDSISPTSLKPGACKYDFGFTTPRTFLALQQLIEVTSEVFISGLTLQAKLDITKSTLAAIGETEARHSAWSLIEVWGADPFTGPVETIFPYANEILDATNQFVVPGSCPPENPIYPRPRQNLPRMSFDKNTTTARPGSNITFIFDAEPKFLEGKEYYAVFYHGVQKVSVPFDCATNQTTIPAAFESKGMILAVIADTPGAPFSDTVVAGPLFLVEQPQKLTLSFGS